MNIRQIILSCTLFLLPFLAFSCGYSYVSTCAHRLDFTINNTSQNFHVDVCTWMTDFQNYQFGTPTTLKLSRAASTTWESCTNTVMNARLYYRIYLTGSTPGAFNTLALTELIYSVTGAYRNREYYKEPNLDLLSGLAGGNYTLELYYQSDVDFNNDNIVDAQLIRNNNGANYKAFFTKTGPPPACILNASTNNIACQDNGTPSNPADDKFTFNLNVSGANTGAGWSTSIAGQNITGSYNTPVALGPYPISGGPLSFTVTDNATATCTAAVTVTPPATCSNATGCSKNVLVIVGDGNAPAAADVAIINRLNTSLGATVTIKDDGVATAADAAGKNLVIITASVNAGQVNTKFRNVAVPVLLWKKDLFDDMQMITLASTQSGSINNVQTANIFSPAHPLAAGLTGSPAIFTSPSTAYWGIPLASASKIVRVSNTKYLVFAYESGAALSAMSAPARRVAFFLHTTFSNNLTAGGWALFDAAVNWSVGCPTTPFAPGQDENPVDALAVASGSTAETVSATPSEISEGIKVYPNPVAGDHVFVNYIALPVPSEVTVVNLLGQVVARTARATDDAAPVEIATTPLPSGIYYVFVRGEGLTQAITGSFIIP